MKRTPSAARRSRFGVAAAAPWLALKQPRSRVAQVVGVDDDDVGRPLRRGTSRRDRQRTQQGECNEAADGR